MQNNISENNLNYDNCKRESTPDRRTQTARSALYSCFRKRRGEARRKDDHIEGHYYVDVYERRLFYVATGAVMLSACDAFFTLILIGFFGSVELNPLMDYFLQQGDSTFFVVKYVLTTVCVLFLVLHKNFKLFNAVSGYQLLVMCLLSYVVLVSYEIINITGVLS